MAQEFAVASTMGFPYGIDWSHPAEAVDIRALVQAQNCEYSGVDGALQTVPGVRILYTGEADITTIYHDVNRKCWYLSEGNVIYKTEDFETLTKLGELTGSNKPRYVTFGGDVLIASGGKLQAITGAGTTLTTIDGSPDCDFVSSNSGSVMVASIYGHRIYWSAIGDYTAWTTDSNDSSSAQWVDVGYKDQGCIISIDFLSKAIIVYKEYGRAYQVIGNPHEKTLTVYPLSETAYCSGSSCSVNDRSYYIGDSGLMSFAPTDTYANIQPVETGLAINSQLIRITDKTAAIWYVPSRKQLWVLPKEGADYIFIYHYLPRFSDGRGVFTTRSFTHDIHDVASVDHDVYIAYGNKVGILDESIDTDDGEQIQTSITSGNKLAQRLFLLLMNYTFVTSNKIPGYGSVTISKKKAKAVSFDVSEKRLYDANDPLYTATTMLHNDTYTKVLKIGGGPNRALQIRILIAKGAVSLRQFDYTYAEV